MSDWVFAALLRLYPRVFRARYGAGMRSFHRDRMRAARQRGDFMPVVWLRVIIDALTSAAAEWSRAGDSSSGTVPFPLPPEKAVPHLKQDIAYSVRGLARRRGFTVVVLATLALGIGANAAIFSVVNGVLLRPLPYPHPDRLFDFGHKPQTWLTSEPEFVEYRRDMRSIVGLAAYIKREATITSGDDPERVRAVSGSADFFPVLGVAPLIGRTFAPDEYVPNPAQVVIISEALWMRRFAADSAVIGKTLPVNGIERTIVGVMPSEFAFPEKRTDVWMPLPRAIFDTPGDRSNHYLFMVGRLAEGVGLDRSRIEATAIARRMMRDNPQSFDPANPLIPTMKLVRDNLVGATRPYLFALLGTVGFVLLIACANVANLLLARGEARRAEMAVRTALGATTRRLTLQLLTESAVLSIIGGVLGLALGWFASRVLVASAPSSIPRIDQITIDPTVIGFTAVVSILTGALIGLVPAWRVSRTSVAGALKEGGRAAGHQAGASRARRALVVAEVALAVVMLSGSGMLLRSLLHLQRAGMGFEPTGVLTARIAILQRAYDDARSAQFYGQLLERIRAIPDVMAVGAAGWLPVVDAGGLWGYRPEGGIYPDGRWPSAVPQQVTPGYFAAIGLPLLSGRDISEADRNGASLTAVVSRRFADQSWPGVDPLGKRFRLGGDTPLVTIVGVVGDFRSRGFGDEPEPTMYFPYAQSGVSAYVMPRNMVLVIRTAGDPSRLAPTVRGIVRSLDATVPVSEVRTLEAVVETSVANRRFSTALVLGFAALALILAGIGTYGVIAYGVTQRTFEIGVRQALGAERGAVLGLVMREGLALCASGLVIGLAGSIATGRLIRALLVGVSTFDWVTLGVVCLLLAVVSVLACLIPARRAMAVSPTEALRGT
jgi:putative ABC transport system permease protein